MKRRYQVIDAEFHLVPQEAATRAEKISPKRSDGKKYHARLFDPSRRSALEEITDLDRVLKHMEVCGVEMAMIGQASWSIMGTEICKAHNDALRGLVERIPGKFIPLATISYVEGQRAVDELTRAVEELGLKGVTLLTSQHGVRLDDEKLKPFFEKARDLGIPVAVHPVTIKPLWGGEKYQMSGSVSREYEIIKAFVEVLCGVLPEFPELNFIFSHYGGGVPFLLGRIMSWYYPPDKDLPKEKIDNPKTIKEFEELGLREGFWRLFDRIYFNMAGTGGWMPAVKQALMVIKPDRLCFGSDFPHEMSRPKDFKGYLDGIKKVDIEEKDKVKILGGNIKRLFKL